MGGIIYCPDCGRRMGIIGGRPDTPSKKPCKPCQVKARIRARLPEPVRTVKTAKKRRKSRSVRTVSGGLPGLGKRR